MSIRDATALAVIPFSSPPPLCCCTPDISSRDSISTGFSPLISPFSACTVCMVLTLTIPCLLLSTRIIFPSLSLPLYPPSVLLSCWPPLPPAGRFKPSLLPSSPPPFPLLPPLFVLPSRKASKSMSLLTPAVLSSVTFPPLPSASVNSISIASTLSLSDSLHTPPPPPLPPPTRSSPTPRSSPYKDRPDITASASFFASSSYQHTCWRYSSSLSRVLFRSSFNSSTSFLYLFSSSFRSFSILSILRVADVMRGVSIGAIYSHFTFLSSSTSPLSSSHSLAA
mmetsp:Transcript_9201/g.24942  ORF Transcript_9201/g.24942 Transcript_9201/m.24942 type:complete len:281 (-) Transcript_9201:166-1008(-)